MDPPSFSSSTAGRLIVRAGWTTGANALQFAALYSTVDSGASWKVQTLPAAALAADLSHALDVFFFAAGPGGNSENQHFWRSHDGGKTWHESPAVLGWYPVDVQFVDGLHGWTRATTKTSGVPVVLNSTADAGETWQDLQPVFPTASPSPTAVH